MSTAVAAKLIPSAALCSLSLSLWPSVENDQQIRGVLLGDQRFKSLMYADETVVIVRSYAEVDRLHRIFNQYRLVLGALVNWRKSFLMLVGNIGPISIPGMETVIV